ncbi:hypothetical protein LZ554_008842 [Drepanopeziza brunnea f. sp. 'monogermtubi']|nr:hypothetical protein LZ554_008842 [Drepanopeziza brunnea f. sp. 'monogermtubi']
MFGIDLANHLRVSAGLGIRLIKNHFGIRRFGALMPGPVFEDRETDHHLTISDNDEDNENQEHEEDDEDEVDSYSFEEDVLVRKTRRERRKNLTLIARGQSF